MPIDSSLKVVAMFGANNPSNDELSAALLLGTAVIRSGSVLLTGGDGSDPTTVKDAAISAAEEESTFAAPATWIGVANKHDSGKPQWKGAGSVVVRPGWGNRRNFVEACLCDCAVVLGGRSAGAASEAYFCLYLGRPVFVLSDAEESVRLDSLRTSAKSRVQPPRQPTWPSTAASSGASLGQPPRNSRSRSARYPGTTLLPRHS